MTFASAVTGKTVFGNKRVHFGTFTQVAGETGGNIDTQLNVCEAIFFTPVSASAIATPVSVNETLPIAGSAITIVTTDGDAGNWVAFGN